MSAWRLYVIGACVLMVAGIAITFLGDKGHFVRWLAMHRTPLADYYFYYVTKLGEEHGFIIIGLLLWLQSWRRMIVIPLLGGLVTLVTYLLKEWFQHERPFLYLERIGWEGPVGVLDYQVLSGHASFPSGHSMAAWALFTLTAAMIRKPWVSVVCLLLAASVSLSRVYLVAHFLRDVIAGAAFGFALGYALYYIFDNMMKKRELRQTFPPKDA
ncbi:MAG TPA: phosphatase PAP2 family protein [Saprospiraceae bacterium]|nr:phosphatase PAP2 family protein [Saprospiraceae bacterium]